MIASVKMHNRGGATVLNFFSKSSDLTKRAKVAEADKSLRLLFLLREPGCSQVLAQGLEA